VRCAVKSLLFAEQYGQQPDAALNHKRGILCFFPSYAFKPKFLESDVQYSGNPDNTALEESCPNTESFVL
jgi:hypothetical protein